MTRSAAAALPRATVPAGEPETTARLLRDQLGPGPHAAILVFAAPTIERAGFAAAMQRQFPGIPVLGCTTAGEIGEHGLGEGYAVAAALPAEHFRVAHALLPDARNRTLGENRDTAVRLVAELALGGRRPTASDTFAILLVDGLSIAEEQLASTLHSGLGEIPLIGGSAGDGLDFARTHVLADGLAHEHAAVLALIQTDLPFTVFKTQHFVPGDRRMVVTSADAPRRVVHELDGERAAAYLAAQLGMQIADLGPTVFATHPVVVRIGGAEYVRSIQKVEADGSLTFYCAIEEGVVLRDARGVGLVENLEETLTAVRAKTGDPLLTFTFDCILRGLECRRDGKLDEVSALLRAAHCIGFSTYGEQFHGMHVNQTLTGVAFGAPRA